MTELLFDLAGNSTDAAKIFSPFFKPNLQCSASGISREIIRQPCMVAGRKISASKTDFRAKFFFRECRARAGVVDPALTCTVIVRIIQTILSKQICLEFIGGLAQIMEPCHIPGPIFRLKFSSAYTRFRSHI